MEKLIVLYSSGSYDDYMEYVRPVIAPSIEEFLMALELAWETYMKEYEVVRIYNEKAFNDKTVMLKLHEMWKPYPDNVIEIFGTKFDITCFGEETVVRETNHKKKTKIMFYAPDVQTLDAWFNSNL